MIRVLMMAMLCAPTSSFRHVIQAIVEKHLTTVNDTNTSSVATSICDKTLVLKWTNGASGDDLDEGSVEYDWPEIYANQNSDQPILKLAAAQEMRKGQTMFEKWMDYREGHHQAKLVFVAHCDEAKVTVKQYRLGESDKTPGMKKWFTVRGEEEELCLGTGALIDGCMYGENMWRSIHITESEQIRILNPDPGRKYFKKLQAGSLEYGIAKPHTDNNEEQEAARLATIAKERAGNSSSAIGEVILESTSGMKISKMEPGCYCCARSWHWPTPFTYTYSQETGNWRPRRHQCKIAWRMVGNFLERGSQNRANLSKSNASGVAMMVPEFILAIANAFTLTLGQHALCAMTCPFRKKPEFEDYSRSFTKAFR